MSNNDKFYRDVIEFHEAMPLPLFDIPAEDLKANLQVRIRLIEEEVLDEFLPTYREYRTTGVVTAELMDAICDSIYVLAGGAMALLDDIPSSVGYVEDFYDSLIDVFSGLNALNNGYRNSGALAWALNHFVWLGESLTPRFHACWDEVHRTNMLKAAGPVVNGKKMKPEGWQPPNIQGILDGTYQGDAE